MEGSVQSIVCVAAHPDDVEHMAGGSLARWIRAGRKVHVLTLTHGGWQSPDGSLRRDAEVALEEERSAAATIGYTVEMANFQLSGSSGAGKAAYEGVFPNASSAIVLMWQDL